jgi:hypothetical protein
MNRAPLLAIVLASLIMARAHANMACPSETLSESQAVELQTRLFSAMSEENRGAWDRLVTPDFVAFERGKQYDSGDFFNLIAAAHKSGRKLVWSVTQPRVQADCNLVVMSYINVGSVAEKDSPPKPVRWLESVAFRKDGDAWRAFLVTSMRADQAAP